MFLLLSYFMYAVEMSQVYQEMSSLEMEVEDNRTGVLIPGLDPPPAPVVPSPTTTASTNTSSPQNPQIPPARRSNIVNPPRRNTMPPNNHHRRCLLHLVMRCPVCFRAPHHRNPRILRQEGVRAILALIRDVFGVNLTPRELSLFIAGYYA